MSRLIHEGAAKVPVVISAASPRPSSDLMQYAADPLLKYMHHSVKGRDGKYIYSSTFFGVFSFFFYTFYYILVSVLNTSYFRDVDS